MNKSEKQELKVERIREYISSGKYEDSWAIEIALETEFGRRLGRLSQFEKQEIDRSIEEGRLGETK